MMQYVARIRDTQEDGYADAYTLRRLTLTYKHQQITGWNRTDMSFPRGIPTFASKPCEEKAQLISQHPIKPTSACSPVSKAAGKQTPTPLIPHPVINPVRPSLQSTISPSST